MVHLALVLLSKQSELLTKITRTRYINAIDPQLFEETDFTLLFRLSGTTTISAVLAYPITLITHFMSATISKQFSIISINAKPVPAAGAAVPMRSANYIWLKLNRLDSKLIGSKTLRYPLSIHMMITHQIPIIEHKSSISISKRYGKRKKKEGKLLEAEEENTVKTASFPEAMQPENRSVIRLRFSVFRHPLHVGHGRPHSDTYRTERERDGRFRFLTPALTSGWLRVDCNQERQLLDEEPFFNVEEVWEGDKIRLNNTLRNLMRYLE